MPQRKIQIASPVTLVDPINGKADPTPITFDLFLNRMFQNPLWNKNWKHGLAMRSIREVYKLAKEKGEDSFLISEEDWQPLKQCAENPELVMLVVVDGNPTWSVQPGWGITPICASQVVEFQRVVVEAPQV